MGSTSLFRPYYYGQYKWDNYLLDIEGSIDKNTQASKEHSQQHLPVQQQILDLAAESVDELREQNRNLVQIRETLENGLEELRAEFHWGFTLMIDRMDHQIEILSEIAERLDAIHKTLQSPLMTQARELFKLGQERFRKGLWDKALEAFLRAEEKNEVDFLLQLQAGKLLLYGKDQDNDVVNLEEAERHLVLAARFAQAEKDSLSEWSKFCGQAHFHAAVAEYLIGEQKQKQGQQGERDQYLRKALEHLVRAVAIWPEFTESINLQAKCHSLLDERDAALSKLQILSDRDRRFYSKAQQDRDFHALQSDIYGGPRSPDHFSAAIS
jgi:tetratricopeptide (TPR) repeat protein